MDTFTTLQRWLSPAWFGTQQHLFKILLLFKSDAALRLCRRHHRSESQYWCRNSQGFCSGKRNRSHLYCHHQVLDPRRDAKEVEAGVLSPDLKVTIIGTDLTDLSPAKLVADPIAFSYDHLDLLINNAAIVNTHESTFKKLIGLKIKQFQKTTEINFIDKITIIKALLSLLVKSDGGAKIIVNVTSAM